MLALAVSALVVSRCGPAPAPPTTAPPRPATTTTVSAPAKPAPPTTRPAPAKPAPPTTRPAPAKPAPPTTAPRPLAPPAPAPLPSPPADASAYLVGGGAVPRSSASEPTGNFRFFCEPSHLAYDDPIVKPGQPGASHLHLFFGNTATSASSTFQSLRTSGHGSCQGGPLNRSAYWIPALFDQQGNVRLPEHIAVYYKGNGPTAANISAIRAYPDGLRMLAGHDMAKPASSHGFYWLCGSSTKRHTTIPSCPAGQMVAAAVEFPSCWDGRNLDSPDHRSHMAYLDWSKGWPATCPASHPVMLPQYSLFAWFAQNGDAVNWHLASDRGMGMSAPNGSTLHADWFGAWDPAIQQLWTRECINLMRDCSTGELGDGRSLGWGTTRYAGPSVVAPPRPPGT